jgi:glycosyltransferase involved in cell wall biosynthesis
LNAIDLLCAPSKTAKNWREQFGRMLVEAGACGIPVIGSDSGEVPRVIGDSGIVVGEDDESGWAARIQELLESPARRRELGQKALARVGSTYAWPVVARGFLDFFDELLATRRS